MTSLHEQFEKEFPPDPDLNDDDLLVAYYSNIKDWLRTAEAEIREEGKDELKEMAAKIRAASLTWPEKYHDELNDAIDSALLSFLANQK